MSYGDVLELSGLVTRRWRRLPLGQTAGKSEAWLRDTLHAHPDLLPAADIDPAYAGLRSVCTELRTNAGSIDNVFVNSLGRLALVECKLWRNPESRRKVVAQVLDYAKELSRWSYSDLQARVNARVGTTGNQLYEIARFGDPSLQEHRFIDATTMALRQGKFMLLIAGDGIREDVEALAELIGRNAAASFAFGMVEAALYGADDGALLLQPRLVTKVRTIERTVFKVEGDIAAFDPDGQADEELINGDVDSSAAARVHAEAKAWWDAVISAPLQDPDQSPPRYYWPHNVRAQLPWPGTWVTAYRSASSQTIGVFLSGRRGPLGELMRALAAEIPEVLEGLPEATAYVPDREIILRADMTAFSSDDAQRKWLLQGLNAFVNELRPRATRLLAQ